MIAALATVGSPRSFLFVPGDRAAQWLAKAERSGADALIVDLEDGVDPARKAEVQASLGAVLSARSVSNPIFVRINAPGSPWFDADLAAVADAAVDGVVVPKSERPDEIRRIVGALRGGDGQVPAILPIIESARGILAATEIGTADPAVVGLALGAEDLAAEMGMRRTRSGREILFARSFLLMAAAAAGIWSIDTPCLDLSRATVIRRDAMLAASLGFSGKFAIHPRQIAPLHEGFAPSMDEVDRATMVVAEAEQQADLGRGVGLVDGQMVDRPVVLAARTVLARAARGNNRPGGT